MLTVIDPFGGARIAIGRGAPTEVRTRLEEGDAQSGFNQGGRRGKPGKATADHNHIRIADQLSAFRILRPSRCTLSAIVFIHVAIAMTARVGRGTRMTRDNTS